MIKNFIYLDEPKLYSFSSQLFEGVTDYVLSEHSLVTEDGETSQERPSSSRIIADVIKETSRSTTKKFLHDHSFTLFENKLKEAKKLLDICELNDKEEVLASIKDYSFIKIKSRALISDSDKLINIYKNFNILGEAMVISQMQSELTNLEKEILNKEIKDKDSAIQKQFEKEYNIKKIALNQSLRLPKVWKDSLTDLLEFSLGNSLQFYQKKNDILFSSLIERSHLRENLDSIIRKYSRFTQKEFVVLGVISTTISQDEPLSDSPLDESSEDKQMKSHSRTMTKALIAMEEAMYGKEKSEVIIEPIAIYTEL